ncbi:MAG: hypothetical protein R3F37_00470 [Candidatus Competibacteraceae bacterium]
MALVMMETLNDFRYGGLFRRAHLTAGLYDVWLGMGNLGSRTDRLYHADFRDVADHPGTVGSPPAAPFSDGETVSSPARLFVAGLARYPGRVGLRFAVLAGFAVPAGVLAGYAWDNAAASWTPEFRTYAGNSLLLSSSAALLAVAGGIFLGYSRRLQKPVLLAAARSPVWVMHYRERCWPSA